MHYKTITKPLQNHCKTITKPLQNHYKTIAIEARADIKRNRQVSSFKNVRCLKSAVPNANLNPGSLGST
jgi:hypothetical protein